MGPRAAQKASKRSLGQADATFLFPPSGEQSRATLTGLIKNCYNKMIWLSQKSVCLNPNPIIEKLFGEKNHSKKFFNVF